MPKDRNKTYSDMQAEAARQKKQDALKKEKEKEKPKGK